MIVMIDTSQQSVMIYTEDGLEEIDFSESEKIYQIIGDDEVCYVTGAVQTSAKEIATLVAQLDAKGDRSVSKSYFLVMTRQGVLAFSEEKLAFNGYGSFIQVYEDLAKKIQNSLAIRTAIKQGTLKLVKEGELKKFLRRKQKIEKKEQNRLKKSAKSIEQPNAVQGQENMSALELADAITSGGIDVGDVSATLDMTGEIKVGREKGMSQIFSEAGIDMKLEGLG